MRPMDALGALLGLVCAFVFLLAPIVFFFRWFGGGGQGRSIQKKFQAAGDLRGKTMEQICVIGGQPIRNNVTPDGRQTAVFGGSGWNIELIFENNVCQGVLRETTF